MASGKRCYSTSKLEKSDIYELRLGELVAHFDVLPVKLANNDPFLTEINAANICIKQLLDKNKTCSALLSFKLYLMLISNRVYWMFSDAKLTEIHSILVH